MGDVSANQTLEGMTALNSNSGGWTDEKHMLYLSSMEASFIEQLYSDEQHADHLVGWLPRTKESTNPSSQFKVLRKGVWENLKFVSTSARLSNVDENCLSENQWIRRFRPRNVGKYVHDVMANLDLVDDHESGTRPAGERGRSHGRDRVCSSENLPCSQTSPRGLVDRNTEVSDQNFTDEPQTEGGAESRRSRACKNKRSRSSSTNLLSDQVVPSAKSHAATGSNGSCLK